VVWKEVAEELQFLDELLKVNTETTDSDPPFSSPLSLL